MLDEGAAGLGTEVRARPVAQMISVGVRDHGAVDRRPRVDVKSARLAVQASRRRFN
jgi:hypothetical protein